MKSVPHRRKIKLNGKKARAIFQDSRCYKQIAHDYAVSNAAISYIKSRRIYSWATRALVDEVRG